ncbi:dipeptidase [bacterium]|jgi:acetylornithine deacetylase/succinyl-diaminopimelate desuccinylase-like protein|nr:dipeptidase [bacterium]
MKDLLDSIDSNFDKYLSELLDFLTYKSISTNPINDNDVRACASYLVNHLQSIGFKNATISETKGHPICYASYEVNPTYPTVLFYGHYDVQPPEPLELWQSPPFEPTIKDGQIIARGASDDKGQVFCHIKALETLLKETGTLPLNVKLLIEGEEEVGSPSLENFLIENKEKLKCDAVVISDTPMYAKDVPSICTSLRGILYSEISVNTGKTDLHSGQHGGAVPNAIHHLMGIISKLKSEDGRVLVPGFYDDVKERTSSEREDLARIPFNDKNYLRETGCDRIEGEVGYSVLERRWYRPTLECNGIWGGYTGDGAKTVTPCEARAKISMRLVSEQDPNKIFRQLNDYIAEITPEGVHFSLEQISGVGYPVNVNTNEKAIEAAADAIKTVYGKVPIFQGEGGSIPIVHDFKQILKVPIVLMGFNLIEDKIHAPNEQFGVENYRNGIKIATLFYTNLGNKRKESKK